MILPTGLPPTASSLRATFVFPLLKRIYLIITSCVLIQNDSPAIHIPSPGADCPAMVIYGAFTIIGDFKWIIPATLKTTILGPTDSQAARNDPEPLSLRVVTT